MINRLFTDIYSNVGSNIQDTSSAMQTILKRYVNDIYFDILKRINWKAIDSDYTISTVAGTQDYPLPNNFGKELSVYDSTNKLTIPYIDFQTLIEKYVDSLTSQGSVARYTTFDSPVRKQPTSSSALSIVSSSASDTSQVIRIKGIDSNGVEIDESVTLNGVTSAPTTNAYTEIRSITKSATTAGRITITSNSGAVTVAILSIADLDYKVKMIRLHLVPSGVITLNVPYYINPYPLVHDYDVPVIDCADVIELGATAKAWRYKRQFSKAADYNSLYEQAIINLIWDKENQPNQVHLFEIKPTSRETV